jgi:hypothetical protein
MPKFRVTVQRTEYRAHTFEVEADDKSAAEELTMDEECGEFDWSDADLRNATEEVTAIEEA